MSDNARTIAMMILAIIVIIIVCAACGLLAWAGGCNIAGVTFNYTKARDSMSAMIGNAFWGWVVCPLGLILIGLLGYAGYLAGMIIHEKRKGITKQTETTPSVETKVSESAQDISGPLLGQNE